MSTETIHTTLKTEPLRIWEKVLIIAGTGYEAGTYVGRIEDFSHGGLVVTAPEFVSGKTLLREDMPVRVQITRNDALYEFDSRVSKKTELTPGHIWLSGPRDFRRVQRRLFVRIEWQDEIEYALVTEGADWAVFPACCVWHKSVMHDISGGGVRITAVNKIESGQVVLFRLPRMKASGFPEYMFAVCRRSFTFEGHTHLGLEFAVEEELHTLPVIGNTGQLPTATRGFTRAVQNKLVVWIFQRQIELRQKGLL